MTAAKGVQSFDLRRLGPLRPTTRQVSPVTPWLDFGDTVLPGPELFATEVYCLRFTCNEWRLVEFAGGGTAILVNTRQTTSMSAPGFYCYRALQFSPLADWEADQDVPGTMVVRLDRNSQAILPGDCPSDFPGEKPSTESWHLDHCDTCHDTGCCVRSTDPDTSACNFYDNGGAS